MRKFKTLVQFIKNPQMLNPHLIVDNVSNIHFAKLKQIGIQYVVFDKDNTLTYTYQEPFFNESIKNSINECQATFGNNNIAVLSNSIGFKQKIYLDKLNLNAINYTNKKPYNFNEVKAYFETLHQKNIQNHQIAFVGDRLMTDVYIANLNGSLSILTKPLERSHEKFIIKILRFFEDKLIQKWTNRRQHLLKHELNKIIK